MTWKPEAFEVAYQSGPRKVEGYTYRGLGLFMQTPPSANGRWPATWNLSHLGTGHCLAHIKGDVRIAFPIATEIAEAGDWSFLSLEGYKDRFPDAEIKLIEICDRHARHATMITGKVSAGDSVNTSHEVARQIAMNRS